MRSSWLLSRKWPNLLVVETSRLCLKDPDCSSSEILVVVLQEMVGNEQNGRHGIIDKGAAKPGFCNSKMVFFLKSFPHLLKTLETRLLPVQDVFFQNHFHQLKTKGCCRFGKPLLLIEIQPFSCSYHSICCIDL